MKPTPLAMPCMHLARYERATDTPLLWVLAARTCRRRGAQERGGLKPGASANNPRVIDFGHACRASTRAYLAAGTASCAFVLRALPFTTARVADSGVC